MKTVNIYDAKAQLSRLVEQAAGGEDVVIARNGRPVARLTGLEEARPPVRLGLLKGKIRIREDFDEPLDPEELAGFEQD